MSGTAEGRPAPVDIARGRIVRRAVGLRPYRRPGFLVRAERLDGTLLVHHYGHGGGGVSLSWGTAELALEALRAAAGPSPEERSAPVAVLGCGVIGLSTAILLQREGRTVTIYARELPPETTSDVAGARWSPVRLADEARRTPEFEAELHRASRLAHRAFSELDGARYGIRRVPQYTLGEEDAPRPSRDETALADLYGEERLLGPDEPPFEGFHVRCNETFLIETPIYLQALVEDFRRAGGRIERRAFRSPAEVAALAEPVVANCTGLGSRELFSDPELLPLKGQLTVLEPQPAVGYVVRDAGHYTIPRRDGILLGATAERGVETLEPNLEAERAVLAWHRRVAASLRSERTRCPGRARNPAR